MGIFQDFFGAGAKHAAGPNQPVPPTPGNIPQGANGPQAGTTGTAPNGAVPTNAQGSETQQSQTPESPFKDFEKLWEPNVGADGKPVQPTENEPLFKVNGEEVMKAAQRTDFRSVATKEQLASVMKGGQEGVEAMMEIMNAMSQSVYANAAVAATKIAENGITKALSQAETRLPGMIRNQSLAESLAAKNPAFNNPAVKPLVEMTRMQLAQKYPNATTAELEKMTTDFMQKVGAAFNPQEANKDQQQQGRQEEDWDQFFNNATGGQMF